jgi:hypothetical protein
MKEEYAQKVAFLHGLQPWVHESIIQRSKVPKSCQKMMKIIKCTSHFVRHVGIWPLNNLRGMLEVAHKLYMAQKRAIKESGRKTHKRIVMA